MSRSWASIDRVTRKWTVQSGLIGLDSHANGGDEVAIGAVLGSWARNGGPLYRQLAHGLGEAIDRGDLRAGERLPPERHLARDLAVSRATVVAAYELLRAEGRVERRQGSGTRVLPPLHEPEAAALPVSRPNVFFGGFLARQAQSINLVTACPAGLPDILRRVSERAAAELVSLQATGGYEPLGYAPLREAVAAYLGRQGLSTVPEQILLTSGAQQAISLLAHLYLSRGDAVVLDDPSYPGAMDAFRAAGARLVGIPAGPHGTDVARLEETVTRSAPRLVYLMPTFHNPLGAAMPEHYRRRVARLAESTQVPVVEDIALTGLVLGDEPPPPIAAYGREGAVLTIGSFSKLFWGGLRLGWVRAPQSVVSRLAQVRASQDLGGALPSQVLATHLMDYADEIEVIRREELRVRYALMTRFLAERLPGWSWNEPAGGLCTWVKLPTGRAEELAQVALRHGVALLPGTAASPLHGFEDYLRLPMVGDLATLEEGLERLARAWAEYAPLAARGYEDRQPVVV